MSPKLPKLKSCSETRMSLTHKVHVISHTFNPNNPSAIFNVNAPAKSWMHVSRKALIRTTRECLLTIKTTKESSVLQQELLVDKVARAYMTTKAMWACVPVEFSVG